MYLLCETIFEKFPIKMFCPAVSKSVIAVTLVFCFLIHFLVGVRIRKFWPYIRPAIMKFQVNMVVIYRVFFSRWRREFAIRELAGEEILSEFGPEGRQKKCGKIYSIFFRFPSSMRKTNFLLPTTETSCSENVPRRYISGGKAPLSERGGGERRIFLKSSELLIQPTAANSFFDVSENFTKRAKFQFWNKEKGPMVLHLGKLLIGTIRRCTCVTIYYIIVANKGEAKVVKYKFVTDLGRKNEY